MREGRPSVTARRVAAYRLGFDRLTAGFGDPSADERLAADVAGAETFEPGERMVRYLRARTSFFDRVVLNAIERGVTQLLVVGAGYDGRSLRYARAGVRWFEVDHPDTQSDKRARLDRLDIGTGHIAFVGADLRDGGLARALLAAAFEADAPAQIICEGSRSTSIRRCSKCCSPSCVPWRRPAPAWRCPPRSRCPPATRERGSASRPVWRRQESRRATP